MNLFASIPKQEHIIARFNTQFGLLILIILIGIFLRTYRLSEFMGFLADSGRDILVAKHIVTYDGFMLAAPVSFGGRGVINNSPLYYWLIAFFWLVTRSPQGMTLVFTVLGVATIPLGYALGKLAKDHSTGITLGLFLSLSHYLIITSRYVWQPNLIPFLTTASLLVLVYIQKQKAFGWLLLLIPILFFGLHIHLSFLPIFIVGMGWVLYDLMIIVRKNMKLFSLSIGLLMGNIIVWIYLTSTHPLVDQIRFMMTIFSEIRLDSLPRESYLRFATVFENLFNYSDVYVTIGIVLLLLFFSCFIFITGGVKRHHTPSIIIFSFVLSILFTSLYKISYIADYYPHYVAPYYVVFLFAFSYFPNRLFHNTVMRTVVICAIAALLFRGNTDYLVGDAPNEFRAIKVVSEQIYQDNLRNNKTKGREYTIFNKGLEDWHFDRYTAPYWYFFENLQGKQLIKLIPDGSNMEPLATHPENVYLICTGNSYEEKDYVNGCIRPFIVEHGASVKEDTRKFLFKYEIPSYLLFYVYRYDSSSQRSPRMP